MDQRTYLRNALKAGKPGIGMWLTIPGASMAKTVATVPGFNWILIDAEHGQIVDSDFFILNNLITQEGVSPIIRVPADEAWLLKRALDSGAHGIMVPMCHDADIAKKVVSKSKYAPQGTRGCGSPFTQQVFGVPEAQYEAECNDNLLVIVQIESADGVKNIDEIAAVPGLDVIFVGPFDLAKSMDIEFGGDEHEAAIAKVLKVSKANGKKAAIFCMSGEKAKKRLQQGFDMVSIVTDTDTLIWGLTKQLEDVKA